MKTRFWLARITPRKLLVDGGRGLRRIVPALVSLLFLLAGTVACAQPNAEAAEAGEPVLRLQPGGPISFISGLAFGNDGQTLYSAGWDKLVQVWQAPESLKHWDLDASATYRVPIGPNLDGVINALALSPSGAWLAVAGQGAIRGANDPRNPGWVVPQVGAMDDEMRQDQGTIYVFQTRTREVIRLRGHRGPVLALAFAAEMEGQPPVLVSAAREWDADTSALVGAVRVWNVDESQQLGARTLPLGTVRPALAAMHTGNDLQQIQVAIAWGDRAEVLRIWDLRDNTMQTAKDGQYNSTLVLWQEKSKLITGSTQRIKLWNPRGNQAAQRPERELSLPGNAVPRALVLVSSRAGAEPDLGAVIVRMPLQVEEDHLRFFNLSTFRLLDFDLKLWNANGTQPAMASAPRSSLLAMAGGSAREVRVFDVAEVLARKKPRQTLRGAGLSARYACLVRKGDQVGLLLAKEAKRNMGDAPRDPTAGNLVFDAAGQRISADLEGWVADRVGHANWQVTLGNERPAEGPALQTISIRGPHGAPRVVRLKPGQRVTDFALATVEGLATGPILALATEQAGQPSLMLYNAASGAPVRQLSAHVERISSLAFAAAGSLLISTSEDRTVCVWSLADLDQVVGARGQLDGVLVQFKEQGLVVDAVTSRGIPPERLARGDRLLGLVLDGQLAEATGALDFYRALSQFKPGETVVVRRTRGNEPPVDVKLVVGQGVDDRKPLFSLFASPSEEQGGWNWIGWSPLGPYEARGEGVEEMLGWHFNTGRADSPTRYALAGEYENLARPGLLDHLLKSPLLPEDEEPPAPAPDMGLWIQEPGSRAKFARADAPTVIEGRVVTLNLSVDGPASQLADAVTWQLGDSAPQPMTQTSAQEWSADLGDVDWQRDSYPLRVVFRTNESEPQEFSRRMQVRFQPPAPRVEPVSPAESSSVVEEEQLTWKCHLEPGASDEVRVAIRLIHQVGADRNVVFERTVDAPLDIEQDLKLQPGDNAFVFTARPVNAAEDSAEDTATLVHLVTYNKRAVPPPKLALRGEIAGESARPLLASNAGPAWIVDSPRLQLRGTIEATAGLIAADWLQADAPQGTLNGFDPAEAPTKFQVDQEITLVPGQQQIRVLAQALDSQPTEVGLLIEYRPGLPRAAFGSPASETVVVAGRDEPQLELIGEFEAPANEFDFLAELWHNEQLSPANVTVDLEKRVLRAEVDLLPGENRFQWRLKNDWTTSASMDPIVVWYKRPPRIVETRILTEEPIEQLVVDLEFWVESPTPLPLTGLAINGWELRLDSATVEKEGPEFTRWKVAARDVPLKLGANALHPMARNEDGWSQEGEAIAVTARQPPAPKPTVTLLNPARDVTVEESSFPLEFSVTSTSKLKRVLVRRASRRIHEVDLRQQSGDDAAGYKLSDRVVVELGARDNRLEVIAVNEGGEAAASVMLTYVPRPVRVVIDKLVSRADSRNEIVPTLGEGGRLSFSQPAAESSQWLHGRVQWASAADRQKHLVSSVHVRVNGFLHLPVALEPSEGLESTFRARLRLNRAKDNVVSLDLPDLQQDAANQAVFHVDCLQPDERQRLHLLVVGVGEQESSRIEELALKAVHGTRGEGDQVTTPAFAQGRIYGPLTKYVSRAQIVDQLFKIHLAIKSGDAADAGNDVVLMYYRGAEAVQSDGEFYLLTSESEHNPELKSSAVSGKLLASFFQRSPGAQVFLLDVNRQHPKDNSDAVDSATNARWPRGSPAGAFRYAWLRDDAAPGSARLLVAVEGALPKASNLGALGEEISRSYEQTRAEFGASLVFDQYIPPDLRDLVLGAP